MGKGDRNMEGLQKWAEKKNLIWPCTPDGTGTSKCGTDTEWPLPLFAQVVSVPVRVVPVPLSHIYIYIYIYYIIFFFSYFCKFGTIVSIYRYTLFECPLSRIPLNAHFFSHSYFAQPDLCSQS